MGDSAGQVIDASITQQTEADDSSRYMDIDLY